MTEAPQWADAVFLLVDVAADGVVICDGWQALLAALLRHNPPDVADIAADIDNWETDRWGDPACCDIFEGEIVIALIIQRKRLP